MNKHKHITHKQYKQHIKQAHRRQPAHAAAPDEIINTYKHTTHDNIHTLLKTQSKQNITSSRRGDNNHTQSNLKILKMMDRLDEDNMPGT